MYQLLILSCKLPQVFLALFIFTPVNSFKTHGKIGREGVYIFGVHIWLTKLPCLGRVWIHPACIYLPCYVLQAHHFSHGGKHVIPREKTEALASNFGSLVLHWVQEGSIQWTKGGCMVRRMGGVGAGVAKIATEQLAAELLQESCNLGILCRAKGKRKFFPREKLWMWTKIYKCVGRVFKSPW